MNEITPEGVPDAVNPAAAPQPLLSELEARRIDSAIETALAAVNEIDDIARQASFLPLALQLANELEYIEAIARLNKEIIRARVEAYQRLHPVPI